MNISKLYARVEEMSIVSDELVGFPKMKCWDFKRICDILTEDKNWEYIVVESI